MGCSTWYVFELAIASSPMKKSRSSIPLFEARFEPVDRPPGFEGTLGLEPLLELPPARLRVAIAVGNTNEGSELPAQPAFVYPVPLSL